MTLQRENDENKINEMIIEYADSIREYKHQYVVSYEYGSEKKPTKVVEAVELRIPNATELLKIIDIHRMDLTITNISKL